MAGDSEGRTPGGDQRPVPDPTSLTTEQLHREVRGLERVLNARFDGMEAVLIERFDKVRQQFDLVERQRVEQKADTQKAVDAALCCAADTPILCADLTWRPAGDLLVGDELIAIDEFAQPGQRERRLVRSVVVANALDRDALLRVNTPVGSVRCNYEHPWLVRRHRGHRWEWRRAAHLRPGDTVMHLFDVWEDDRSYEAGWLAGILDGEGCLTFKSDRRGAGRVSIGQVAGITADAIEEALKTRGIAVGHHTRVAGAYESRGYSGKAQAQQRWQVSRRADVMKLLGSVRPARLLVNADQVWEGRVARARDRMTTVTSVEGAGSGLIAVLSTSTKTYIAGGFVTHNSAQKEAVRAQTIASERAIAKSEAATTKQLEQLGATFKSDLGGVVNTLSDVKDRVGRIENLKVGGQQAYAGLYVMAGLVVSVIVALVALGVFKK